MLFRSVERHDCELPLGEKSARRNLARYGEETLRLLLEVKRADNLAQAAAYQDRQTLIRQWEELLELVLAGGDCFSLKHLAVKGGDLTALGLQGPAVGRGLGSCWSWSSMRSCPTSGAYCWNM